MAIVGLEKMGKTVFHACKFEPTLLELGFEGIEQRRFGVPMNSWPTDQKYRRLGLMNGRNNFEAATPLSYATISKGLGLSIEETDKVVNAMKKDMENTRIQGYTSM